MTYDCETGRFDLGTSDSDTLEIKNQRRQFFNPMVNEVDSRMCNWKYTMSFSGTILSSIEIVKNKIRKFAFEQGFEVEFYTSGIFFKEVEMLAHGRTTVSKEKAIREALVDYFRKLNEMFE